MEIAVLVHVGGLLVLSSWAFGGAADWARTLIATWGSLGIFITIAAIRHRAADGESVREPVKWLIPWLGFNVMIVLSCLNPSFTERLFAGQTLLAHTGAAHSSLPSTAQPRISREHLWLFDASYLACFNLVLAIRRRRALRGLIVVAVINGVLLSVFGTFQKLTSDGLYFGRVPSPNPRFFATFVYHNHWSAFVVLLLAACLGLIFHYSRHPEPGPSNRTFALGITGLILMAITPVVAGSRSGTLLVVVLLGVIGFQVLRRLRRARRQSGESTLLSIAGLALATLLAVGGAIYLGRDALRERWQDTQGQWREGMVAERLRLYADTCQLATEQPLFGWGLGCYEQVFQLLRPRPLEANRQYEHSYVDAHSDWLQSLAETGTVGTVLILFCGFAPLLGSRAFRGAGLLPSYLLGGCGLILLYAAVEFPFGNPAVVILFWTCFFSAVQYCRLSSRPTRIPPRPSAAEVA